MKQVSILYLVSYASLLSVGTLSASFANPALGAILFLLGLVLLSGDEYAKSRQRRKSGDSGSGLPSEISGMVVFSLASCALSISAAALLSQFYGWDSRVLLLAVSGLVASAAKVASATAGLFLAA